MCALWVNAIVTMPPLTVIRPRVITTCSGQPGPAALLVGAVVVALVVLADVLLLVELADRLGLAVAVAVPLSDDPPELDADGPAPASCAPAVTRKAAARTAPDRRSTGRRAIFEVRISASRNERMRLMFNRGRCYTYRRGQRTTCIAAIQ